MTEVHAPELRQVVISILKAPEDSVVLFHKFPDKASNPIVSAVTDYGPDGSGISHVTIKAEDIAIHGWFGVKGTNLRAEESEVSRELRRILKKTGYSSRVYPW